MSGGDRDSQGQHRWLLEPDGADRGELCFLPGQRAATAVAFQEGEAGAAPAAPTALAPERISPELGALPPELSAIPPELREKPPELVTNQAGHRSPRAAAGAGRLGSSVCMQAPSQARSHVGHPHETGAQAQVLLQRWPQPRRGPRQLGPQVIPAPDSEKPR